MTNAATAPVDTSDLDASNMESHDVIYLSGDFPNCLDSADVKEEWRESFSEARTFVSLASPLMAYMMFNCKYHWVDDPRIKTAAAMPKDGVNHIFINPTFWMTGLKNTEQRSFVLLHEILHIFLEHSGRQVDMGYNHELWNIATDYHINLTCAGAYREDENSSVQYAKKYRLYMEKPTFVLFDERFIEMSSDEIYHLLLEENDQDAQKAIEACTGGQQAGEDGQPQGGNGGGTGQVPLDRVSGEAPDREQQAANRQTASAAVASAASSNMIGDSEGNLAERLHNMSKPVVDWREELAEAVQTSTKERYTYNRLSRREGDGGVVFPSLTGRKISVCFGFDSSGSMGAEDYADVGGELSGVLDQFEAWELYLLSCDVKAFELGYYASDDGDDLSTMTLEARGGGGTDMTPLVTYSNDLVDSGEEINACIVVTDGYIPVDDLEREFSDELVNIVVVTRGGNKHLTLNNAKVIFMNQER